MKRIRDLEVPYHSKMRQAAGAVLVALATLCITAVVPGEMFAAELTQPVETSTVQVEAGSYNISETNGVHSISMPGYGTLQSPGDPALPEKIIELKVPNDIDWSTLKVTLEVQGTDLLAGQYTIAPNPPLLMGKEEYWGEGKHIVNGRNMNVYGKDAVFPEASLQELPYTVRKEPVRAESGEKPSKKIAFETASYVRVAYRPLQYNPVTRQLTLNGRATVKATYRRQAAAQASEPSLQPAGTMFYDYVIITTDAIVANSEKLTQFIHLKAFQGYTVRVVTESEFGSLTGQYPDGRAEKIRQWLIVHHAIADFDYVLLIGDPNPDDPFNPTDHAGDIPMQYAWPGYYGTGCWTDNVYRGSPTDFFYADLSGNWDLDGDGIYGEGLSDTNAPSPYPGDSDFDDGVFSVLWHGQIAFDANTTYRLHTLSDDHVVITVDSTQVLLSVDDDEPHNTEGDIYKTAGTYEIWIEYFADNAARRNSIVKLWWSTPNLNEGDPGYIAKEIVPSDHLYDEDGLSGGLDARYYSDLYLTGTEHERKDSTIDFIWAQGDRGAGGPDVGAEVAVGRIPVYDDDYAQLDAILEKIIRYETAATADIGWRKTGLLAMAPLADNTPAYQYGEETMNNILGPAGFSSYRLYEENYASVGGPTPDDHPSSVAKVKAEWQNGYGLVTWWTHGWTDSASKIFNAASAVDLDDTRPAFTYQATCLNGYPEEHNNLGYALLKNGAVSTIAATRVSSGSRGAWTYDPASSANPNFGYKYIDHLVTDGYPAAPAFFAAKATVAALDHNGMIYNVNGDPSIYFLTTTPNEPPVADAGGPYSGNEGASITFSAAGSSDPEGDALLYRWDFDNDGTWDTLWSGSATASHIYCDDFAGSVMLEVRDGLGFTDTATASVTISNVPPVVNAGEAQTADEGDTVSFDGNFTDAGSCDTHTYEWDFGDASPTVTDTLTPEHAYGDNGVYTVTLTVTDDDGGVGTHTLKVVVFNVAPTLTGIAMEQPNPQFILPVVHTLDFEGNFTDPGWLDTHTASWDFGDSTPAVSGTVSEENDKPDATGSSTADHVYGEPGTYTVTVTVTDDDGGSGALTMEVVVVTAEEAKHDINDYIQGLPDSAFKGNAKQRKKAFDNMINAIDDMLDNEEYEGAIAHLINNIRSKVDGAGTDWIIDPAAQTELMMKIDDLVAYLEYLKTL